MSTNFHTAVPIFNVEDLQASIAYYQDVLGFQLEWNYEDVVCSVKRIDCELMLAQKDQGQGKAWAYVGVGDVKILFEEFKKAGAIIRQGPTNFSWACEIQIEDPDGNVIRFASDPQQDLPYGPWLDMDKKAWELS